MDPLNDMKRFVSQTKKHSAAGQSTGSTSRPPLIATPHGPYPISSSSRTKPVEQSDPGKSDERERRKSQDHKHHKEHKKSKLKHKKKEKEQEKEARLEELRRERKKREEAERAKAETLLRLRHSQGGREGQVTSMSQVVEHTAGRYDIVCSFLLLMHAYYTLIVFVSQL